MIGRKFAMLSVGLPNSKKMLSLSGDAARWAYVCAHVSQAANLNGFYRYPVVIWAYDAQRTRDEMEEIIAELCRAGLIEYSADDEYVRIVDWHHKANAPQNFSTAKKRLSDLRSADLPRTVQRLNALSELAVAILERAESWEKQGQAALELLSRSLTVEHKEAGEELLEALQTALRAHRESLLRERLCELFPPFNEWQKPAPKDQHEHRADTLSAQDRESTEKKNKPKGKERGCEGPSVSNSRAISPELLAKERGIGR